MRNKRSREQRFIESKDEIVTFLDNLLYALNSGNAKIELIQDRAADKGRVDKYTNRYTLLCLFPNEDPVEKLTQELATLSVDEYIETVKDIRFEKRSPLRVFCKKYGGEDVYIKLRVELLKMLASGIDNYILVLSFHYAEKNFIDGDFPHRTKR